MVVPLCKFSKTLVDIPNTRKIDFKKAVSQLFQNESFSALALKTLNRYLTSRCNNSVQEVCRERILYQLEASMYDQSLLLDHHDQKQIDSNAHYLHLNNTNQIDEKLHRMHHKPVELF
jgi:hypothetical protein